MSEYDTADMKNLHYRAFHDRQIMHPTNKCRGQAVRPLKRGNQGSFT